MTRWLFYRSQSQRSRMLCEAVKKGLARIGIICLDKHEADYGGIEADVAVFYGLWGNLRLAQHKYAAKAKAVFIDLGYWGRIEGGKLSGYHRIVVNGRHATAYFQRVRHAPDRFRRFGITPQPFVRSGEHVVLAGMSGKAAWVYDLAPGEWERRAIARLQTATPRPIWYRPKPSWKHATPLDGALFVDRKVDIEQLLDGAWAAVTHHGNVALDALIAGVPAFCEDGLASVLCPARLEDIERPEYPDEAARDQLLFDAAYTQWKVSEIEDGLPFRHLMEEGLL